MCDRFFDSTRAYQGAGGGVSPGLIAALEQGVVGADRPDVTLVFDLPAEVGLERAALRHGGEARFEGKGLDFHNRLRTAYLEIAEREPDRCALIDAAPPPNDVAETVWIAVEWRLVHRAG